MLILLDDIKLNSAEVFYPYVSNFFGIQKITDENSLYDTLTEYDGEIEIIVNDFDDITAESKPFANKVMRVLRDVKVANKQYTLTIM